MSTVLDLLFGNDAEKRKAGLQITRDITQAVAQQLKAEFAGQTITVEGNVSVNLTITIPPNSPSMPSGIPFPPGPSGIPFPGPPRK